MSAELQIIVAAIAGATFSGWMLYLAYQAVRTGETYGYFHNEHIFRELNPVDFFLVTGVRLFIGLLGFTVAVIVTFG